jgi:hypothetical protein
VTLLRRLATTALMALALSACVLGRDQPVVFQIVLHQPANADPLPVEVRDVSGLVRAVSADDAGVPIEFVGRGGVANPPGRPDALAVGWTGGACDQRVDLAVSRGAEGRLHLELGTDVAPGACIDIGIPRSLVLVLAQPVPADEAILDFLPD